jgi:hypothetical protein
VIVVNKCTTPPENLDLRIAPSEPTLTIGVDVLHDRPWTVTGVVRREQVFLVPGADLHHVRHLILLTLLAFDVVPEASNRSGGKEVLCDGEAHEYAESSRNDHNESDQHTVESHLGREVDGFR